MEAEVATRIKELENAGELDPKCNMCIKIFYPYYENVNGSLPFAPRHKASKRCQSGKHNHCTCDTCF